MLNTTAGWVFEICVRWRRTLRLWHCGPLGKRSKNRDRVHATHIREFTSSRQSAAWMWRRTIPSVAVDAGSTDAVATILKVKKLADEIGGMKTLKSLIEALSE